MFGFACVVGELGICDWACLVKTMLIHGLAESWVAFVIFVVRSCGVFGCSGKQVNIVRSVEALQWNLEM